jgi:hypothetical protein
MADPRPLFAEIREVDIREPFLKWYQMSRDGPKGKAIKERWYQMDGRSYEFFHLDGYQWTKQLRGSKIDVTISQLELLAKEHGQSPYDIATNTCHDARESIMKILGVDIPQPRYITRITGKIRPMIPPLQSSSRNAGSLLRDGTGEADATGNGTKPSGSSRTFLQ